MDTHTLLHVRSPTCVAILSRAPLFPLTSSMTFHQLPLIRSRSITMHSGHALQAGEPQQVLTNAPARLPFLRQHCHFAGVWPCSPAKRSVPISPVAKVFKQRSPPASFFFSLSSLLFILFYNIVESRQLARVSIYSTVLIFLQRALYHWTPMHMWLRHLCAPNITHSLVLSRPRQSQTPRRDDTPLTA